MPGASFCSIWSRYDWRFRETNRCRAGGRCLSKITKKKLATRRRHLRNPAQENRLLDSASREENTHTNHPISSQKADIFSLLLLLTEEKPPIGAAACGCLLSVRNQRPCVCSGLPLAFRPHLRCIQVSPFSSLDLISTTAHTKNPTSTAKDFFIINLLPSCVRS